MPPSTSSIVEKLSEPVEPPIPGISVRVRPLLQRAEAGPLQPAEPHAPRLLRARETRVLQDLQMLRDRGQGDAERLREIDGGDLRQV